MELLGKFLEENEHKISKEPPQDQRREVRTRNGTFLRGQQQAPQGQKQNDVNQQLIKKIEELEKKVNQQNNGQGNTKQNKEHTGQSKEEKTNKDS